MARQEPGRAGIKASATMSGAFGSTIEHLGGGIEARPGLKEERAELGNGEILREEFNRWAEAGRGEGMEQDHLPITLPVVEKMRLAAADNVLDVGCGSGWLARRLAKRGPGGRGGGVVVL